ncbi:MAG: LacI family DNA-binding transcriptional regulator [Acidobacteriota bacterium]
MDPKSNPSISIREVAAAARVSVATISRVLNGKGPIHPDTRQRVLEVVAELGYVPHSGARSLSTRRTSSVGVILPDVYGEFFSELIRGIDLGAKRAGYHLLVSGSHSDPAEVDALIRALHGRVDGLIIMASTRNAGSIRIPPGVPAVFLGDPPTRGSHPSMRIDNSGGARAVAEHLLDLGHRRIAVISGPSENSDAEARLLGFRAALDARGVELDPEQLVSGDFREESGRAAALALTGRKERPTAIFAANDAMAIGCLSALRELGLSVPEDVALAGFDDVPIARYLSPPLTSVRVAIAEMGERAMARLLAGLEERGAEPLEETIPAVLVVRASTAGRKELPGTE